MQFRFCALILAGVFGSGGCHDPSLVTVDVQAPVVEVVLDRRVSTTPTLELVFSKPMASETLSSESVVLVAHRLGGGGFCDVDLACPSLGRCVEGVCQHKVVDEAWLKDLAHPPLSASRRALVVPATLTVDEGGYRAWLTPAVKLEPDRLHTLLIAPTLRDRRGNRLASDGVYRKEFLTDDGSRAKPRPAMVWPQNGAVAVPTNLRALVFRFDKHVEGLSRDTVRLVGPRGNAVGADIDIDVDVVKDAGLCSQWPVGQCYALRPWNWLEPRTTYALRFSQGIWDTIGQAPLITGEMRFATGPGPDHIPPKLTHLSQRLTGECLILDFQSDEQVRVTASLASVPPVGMVAEQGRHEIALETGGVWGWQNIDVGLADLAGNSTLYRYDQHFAILPKISITEVMANPSGVEPAQEWIEIFNGEDSAISIGGWTLDDNDDGQGINHLPAAVIPAKSFALLVGPKFKVQNMSGDLPPPATTFVRLSTTLGAQGLANGGEMLALRNSLGRLVSSAVALPSPGDGRSLERVSAGGCDLRENWRANSERGPSPGAAPTDLPWR
jgi:hypothetical protein